MKNKKTQRQYHTKISIGEQHNVNLSVNMQKHKKNRATGIYVKGKKANM